MNSRLHDDAHPEMTKPSKVGGMIMLLQAAIVKLFLHEEGMPSI